MGNDERREVRDGEMVARYALHLDDGYIEEVFEGPVQLKGALEFLQRIVEDPEFHPELHGLVDLSAAQIRLSHAEMMQIAALLNDNPRASRGCWAFVVSGPLEHGMVRMLEGLSDDRAAFQIFRSRDEAREWLRGQPR